MASMQMNLRIDEQVKQLGDAVLLEAGYSPTQAVRAVWSFAAAHVHEPQKVRQFLQQAEIEQDARQDARKRTVRAALKRCDDLRAQLDAAAGASGFRLPEDISDKELRDGALVSRWEERGVL